MFKGICEDLNRKLYLAKSAYKKFVFDFGLVKEYNLKDLQSTRTKAKLTKGIFKMITDRFDLIDELEVYTVVDNLSLGILNDFELSSTDTKEGENVKIKDRDSAIDWIWENGDIDYVKKRIIIFGNLTVKTRRPVFLSDNIQIGNLDLENALSLKLPKRLIVDDLRITADFLQAGSGGYFPYDIQINGNIYIRDDKKAKSKSVIAEARELKKAGKIKGDIIIE